MPRSSLSLLLALVLAAAGAQTPTGYCDLFDEAAAGDGVGLYGSQLRLGRTDGQPGLLSPAEAQAVALVDEAGRLPVVEDRPFAGRHCLRVAVLGQTVGWWEARLPVRVRHYGERAALVGGALSLALRGAAGGEALDLGLLDGATPAHAARLPLGRYGTVAQGWRLFRVPLADFMALAPALDVANLAAVQLFCARPEPLSVDVDAVRLEFAASPRPPTPVDVPVVPVVEALPEPATPERPAGPVASAEPPVATPPPAGGLELLGDELPGLRLQGAAQAGGPPLSGAALRGLFGLTTVGDPEQHGRLAQLTLTARLAWWSARLSSPRVVDARELRAAGRLEVVLRAEPRSVPLWLGLGAGPDETSVPLALAGSLTAGWSTLRLPLAWLADARDRFDWSRVDSLVLAGADGRPATLTLARARLVP